MAKGRQAEARVATGEETARLLGKCLLFRALGEPARQVLARYAFQRRYRAGAPIFHLGAPGESMIVILEGNVRVTIPGPSGRTVILADLSVGDLMGEIALLDGKGRSANATALTNCSVAVLERRDVLAFLDKQPEAYLKLLALLCERLRRSDERMTEIAFFELPARLAKLLLNKAKAPSAGRAPRLSLSQSELGAMINGSRENVNRCLKDWQRRGVVEVKQRWISLLQPAVLRGLAGDA